MGNYSDKIMSKMPHEMNKVRVGHELARIFRAKRIKEKYKMGYRSAVAYTIRFTAPYKSPDVDDYAEVKECKASFYTFLAEAKVKHSGCFTEAFGVVVDEDNMALNFFADGVKWYEDYPDVMEHEALMSLSREWLDMENKYIGGIFIRIGEESDDIAQDGWGDHDWDWLSTRRSIMCDWRDD